MPKEPKEVPNHKADDRNGSDRNGSDSRLEDHEYRNPMNVIRKAFLDRKMPSSDHDTLHGGSSTPLRPPSPFQNHDKMGSGPHYHLKITVYETTHRGW